jgi:hypothetical protein
MKCIFADELDLDTETERLEQVFLSFKNAAFGHRQKSGHAQKRTLGVIHLLERCPL